MLLIYLLIVLQKENVHELINVKMRYVSFIASTRICLGTLWK